MTSYTASIHAVVPARAAAPRRGTSFVLPSNVSSLRKPLELHL